MLGGNINASAYKTSQELDYPSATKEGRNTTANLQSKSAYFVMHDWAVGLDVTLNHVGHAVTTEQGEEKYRRTMLLAGPFTRYYLDNGVFGELGLQMGLFNFSTGEKIDLYQGTIGVGYSHFINEKIALEPLISFRYYRETADDLSNVTIGPMFGFGVQAYLLRKRAHVIKETL